MSQEYPTFSMNERCFELIQNIVEDRKEQLKADKKHPLLVYNVAEIRLLIDMIREAYPLYKDADIATLIDFVQDIFGVKVSDKELKEIEINLEPERILVSNQYRPLRGCIEILPGLEYEIFNPTGSIDGKKMHYGWIKERFGYGITHPISYNSEFMRIWEKAQLGHIRIDTKYKFKIGDTINHLKDNNLKGTIKYRIPAGTGWSNSRPSDVNTYAENSYLIQWLNDSDKVDLKSWYDESELLIHDPVKLEAMPMKTSKKEKEIIDKLKNDNPILKKVNKWPKRTKKASIIKYQHHKHGAINTITLPKNVDIHNAIIKHLQSLKQDNYDYGIISIKQVWDKIADDKKRQPKPIVKPKKKKSKPSYTIHHKNDSPDLNALVCVKHEETGVVSRIPKYKAQKFVKNENYKYCDKTEWRKYLAIVQQKKDDKKPGLNLSEPDPSLGYVLNRSNRKMLNSTKGSLKRYNRNVIVQRIKKLYPRKEIKQLVRVPIIKKVTKIFKIWDEAKEKIIAKYFKYGRKLVGFKEEMQKVILPERILEKIILTRKQLPHKRPVVSKEDREQQSFKDKNIYLKNKQAELKVLSKEYSSLANFKEGSLAGKKMQEIREMIVNRKPNKDIKTEIKSLYNGFDGARINKFLRYLKLSEKYGKNTSND